MHGASHKVHMSSGGYHHGHQSSWHGDMENHSNGNSHHKSASQRFSESKQTLMQTVQDERQQIGRFVFDCYHSSCVQSMVFILISRRYNKTLDQMWEMLQIKNLDRKAWEIPGLVNTFEAEIDATGETPTEVVVVDASFDREKMNQYRTHSPGVAWPDTNEMHNIMSKCTNDDIIRDGKGKACFHLCWHNKKLDDNAGKTPCIFKGVSVMTAAVSQKNQGPVVEDGGDGDNNASHDDAKSHKLIMGMGVCCEKQDEDDKHSDHTSKKNQRVMARVLPSKHKFPGKSHPYITVCDDARRNSKKKQCVVACLLPEKHNLPDNAHPFMMVYNSKGLENADKSSSSILMLGGEHGSITRPYGETLSLWHMKLYKSATQGREAGGGDAVADGETSNPKRKHWWWRYLGTIGIANVTVYAVRLKDGSVDLVLVRSEVIPTDLVKRSMDTFDATHESVTRNYAMINSGSSGNGFGGCNDVAGTQGQYDDDDDDDSDDGDEQGNGLCGDDCYDDDDDFTEAGDYNNCQSVFPSGVSGAANSLQMKAQAAMFPAAAAPPPLSLPSSQYPLSSSAFAATSTSRRLAWFRPSTVKGD